MARVGSAPSLAQHDSSSCNGCEQGQAGKEATCGLICGADLWVYVAIFAPLAEIPSPAPPQPVPFSFRIRVAGMRMQHVLDLPTCAFAQVHIMLCCACLLSPVSFVAARCRSRGAVIARWRLSVAMTRGA